MMDTQTHPAYVAHCKGGSRELARGIDYVAYVVPLTSSEYILTVWSDGRIGIQKV